MKKVLVLLTGLYSIFSFGQLDAEALLGLPTGTTAEMNAVVAPNVGALLYNTTDDAIYIFTLNNGWITLSSIYTSNGELPEERTVDMNTNQLNFDAEIGTRSNITLRRTNNAFEIGIAFRNSGNTYPAAIALGTTANGNSNGLDFYAGGNQTNANALTKTLSLQNDNQIEFSQYGSGTFDNNSPTRLLGVETNGNVIEVDPSTIGTDDQNAAEVPLVTNLDVNEGGVASPTIETNVEEVIQAIAPITSIAARIFYPPSIAVDASTTGTGFQINLYDQYLKQYSLTPDPVGGLTPRTAFSTGAPSAIPTYTAAELYYYVTYADPTVFNNILINGSGVMTYDIIATPIDFNSLINVVFVVK